MNKLVILIFFSIFLSGCLKTPPKPESEPAASPQTISPIEALTKDWQQFENQKYSYLIKYPQEWHFHPQALNPPPPQAIFLANVPPGKATGSYASFTVFIDEAFGRNLTSYSEITEAIDEGYVNSDLEISGSPAVLLVGNNQNQHQANIYVLRNDLFYRLGWQGTDENSYQQNKEVFKKILATFKFTN